MAGLNKVMVIGRLGRDPEIKYSQSGLAVCNFSVATSESWADKTTGEKQEKTEWHNIVCFGKQAEIIEKYLSKGSQVYLEGRLQTDQYEKEGQTHYMTKIVVNNFQFIGGKEKQEDRQQQRAPYGGGQRQGPEQQPAPDDDIPF